MTAIVDVKVDGWRCRCGNTADSDGFYSAKDGEEIEPTLDSGWDGRTYICGACNVTFDMRTGIEVK